MKYFHRTSVSPDAVLQAATAFFGTRLTPVEEAARRRRFTGAVGNLAVAVEAEGGITPGSPSSPTSPGRASSTSSPSGS